MTIGIGSIVQRGSLKGIVIGLASAVANIHWFDAGAFFGYDPDFNLSSSVPTDQQLAVDTGSLTEVVAT